MVKFGEERKKLDQLCKVEIKGTHRHELLVQFLNIWDVNIDDQIFAPVNNKILDKGIRDLVIYFKEEVKYAS